MATQAATALVDRPPTSDRPARAASRHSRSTRPTALAVIGSRSGLIAMAPTTRIDDPVSTPTPAITPAAIMNTRSVGLRCEFPHALPTTSAHTWASGSLAPRRFSSGKSTGSRRRPTSSAAYVMVGEKVDRGIGRARLQVRRDVHETVGGDRSDHHPTDTRDRRQTVAHRDVESGFTKALRCSIVGHRHSRPRSSNRSVASTSGGNGLVRVKHPEAG